VLHGCDTSKALSGARDRLGVNVQLHTLIEETQENNQTVFFAHLNDLADESVKRPRLQDNALANNKRSIRLADQPIDLARFEALDHRPVKEARLITIANHRSHAIGRKDLAPSLLSRAVVDEHVRGKKWSARIEGAACMADSPREHRAIDGKILPPKVVYSQTLAPRLCIDNKPLRSGMYFKPL
jgi:hypothetical protein